MKRAPNSVAHRKARRTRLAEFRLLALQKGFQIGELADALGVHRVHLRQVIIGDRQSRSLKEKIVKKLGSQADEFFGAEKETRRAA